MTGSSLGRQYDAIVVGGGHNGMVAAAYLGRAGLRTLVLERRDHVGGAAETVELEPGVRAPGLAHTVGRLRPSVARDLNLREHGLSLVAPEVRTFAPQPDGRAVTLWADVERTTRELRGWSSADAEAYAEFDRLVRSLGGFLSELGRTVPPDVKSPSLAEGLTGLRLGRALRGLGKHDGRALLRVLPMAVADFVAEWFETDAVRAAIGYRGVHGAAMGPWSAGTSAVLLADSAGTDGGAAGQTVFARGGPGALASALLSAAHVAGVEVRCNTEVISVTSADGRATGVALASGEQIGAPVVVSNLDPKRSLTSLVDPLELGPNLRWRADNYRTPGVVAKVNLGLAELPRFTALASDPDGMVRLRGRIVIAPGIDYLERAFDASKYGRISEAPYLEATIPSLVDPGLVADAPSPRHVMSVHVQYAPYRLRGESWDSQREALGDLVLRVLETYAPGIVGHVTSRQVITPVDLERDYGLTGGHPLHGEPSLDQFFLWRPLFGHARYRMPLDGLYLCGSGAHPGGGITGGPGQNAAREIVSDWKRRKR